MDSEHLYTSIFCAHCGYTVSIPIYCQNRFCPVCSYHRNQLIRYKLNTFIERQVLRKYDSFKFLTLTIKNDPDLQRMTAELIKSFRRLRQRSVWKKHVRGGCSVIEVKRGKEGWHVHLHIVIESGYVPFKVLLTEWKAVSSGQGVFIKKLHSSQVVGYLTKYLTKEQATEADQEYMTVVLKGTRLFQPFGSWHKPMKAIKRLRFHCPECQRVDWGFGNRNHWFDVNAMERTVIKRINEGLPFLSPVIQLNLLDTEYLSDAYQ